MKRSFDLQRITPAVILAIAALARPASAQPSAQKAAAAQVLFDDAMILLDKGDTAAACPKLEASQRLDPGMGTQFRLAECHEKAGRTATAWSLFLAVAESARIAKKPERETVARARAAALAPSLLRMTVRVPGPVAALPGLQITSDGVVIEAALWGVAVPVDRIEHTVVASAPGRQSWVHKTAATPTTRSLDVIVAMLENPSNSGPAAVLPIVTPAPASGRRSLVPAFVIGGAGVVGVGVGAALLAASASALADAKTTSDALRAGKKSCDPAFSNFAGATACDALGAKTAKVDTLHDAGLVPIILGGAAIGGALLYALWPSGPPKSDAASARIAPMVGHGEGGLLIAGSF